MRNASLPLIALSLFSVPASSDPEVAGRVMLDHALFDGAHNGHERGSEWQLRRARIGIEHEERDWEAELEVDFDNEDDTISVKNATLGYVGWAMANITVGKMKEPFGLENKTSSLDIATMERSIVTEVFSPGRNMGIELQRGATTHSWNLGVFQTSEDEDGLDGYALTGRATVSPINREGAIAHLGISGSARNMRGQAYEINAPMEVNVAEKVIETPEIVTDTIESASLEGALVYNQFSLQSEWMMQKVSPVASPEANRTSFQFDGHYVLASYFLTGESRIYDEGSFDRPESAREAGAWELVARYSSIDLTDIQQGTSATSIMLGVNWYATPHVRAMINLAQSDVKGSDSDESGSGDALSFRLQYEL